MPVLEVILHGMIDADEKSALTHGVSGDVRVEALVARVDGVLVYDAESVQLLGHGERVGHDLLELVLRVEDGTSGGLCVDVRLQASPLPVRKTTLVQKVVLVAERDGRWRSTSVHASLLLSTRPQKNCFETPPTKKFHYTIIFKKI